MVLVSKTKIIEDDTFLEIFLGGPEKHVFWRIYENWPSLVKDSHQTKCQKNKGKIILESPNLPLTNKIKIFIFEGHKTSYGHLKVWSKMDNFDLSGIATQNWHKNVKFSPKLDLWCLFCR